MERSPLATLVHRFSFTNLNGKMMAFVRLRRPVHARWMSSNSSRNGTPSPKAKSMMPRVQFNRDLETSHQEAFASEAVLEEVREDEPNVTAWGINQFRVNGNKITGPIILTKKLVFKWKLENENATVKDLKIEDFELFSMIRPSLDLIILGTGSTIVYPDPKFLKQLREIAPVEVVDSVNAGATFNLLSKDDRQIAAALLPVQESQ